MNPFLNNIIKSTANNYLKQQHKSPNYIPSNKEVIEYEISIIHFIKSTIFIAIGVLSATFALKSFILPNAFIDGGVTGISILVSLLTKIPVGILIVVVNIPFLFLGLKQISKNFVIRSIISISTLAICITLIDFPVVTHDKLLTAVFGGFFLGTGIGMSIRGGSVIDGTEILALYLSKKIGASMGDIIWLVNIVIFSIAAYFLTIETALYSILIYFSASKTADFIIEGIEEYIGVTIVSNHSDEIRQMITHKLGRGVTVYKAKRGYSRLNEPPLDMDVIYTVITRIEIAKLKSEIEKIDRKAFIVMNSIKEAKGGMVKKRTIKDK